MLSIKYLSGVLMVLISINSKNLTISVEGFSNNNLKYEINECDMIKDSQITIQSTMARSSFVPPVEFKNLNKFSQHKVELSNSGVTLNVELTKPFYYDKMWKAYDRSLPFVKGGPLGKNIYITEYIHFQWRSNNTHGTEHVINEQKFSLEMHILNRNSKYKSIEEAEQQSDGLAVLGVLFNATDTATVNTGLFQLSQFYPMLAPAYSKKVVDSFFFNELLQRLSTDSFYYYEDRSPVSFCGGNATWIIFDIPISIPEHQIISFNFLLDPSGKPIGEALNKKHFKSISPINLYKRKAIVFAK